MRDHIIDIIVLAVIAVGFAVPMMFNGTSNKFEYYQMLPWANARDMYCEAIDLDLKVYVVREDLPDDTIGQWRSGSNTIALEETDIDTIAHEVYHMVWTMADRYNLDEEQGAYMAGGFTNCVNQLANQ